MKKQLKLWWLKKYNEDFKNFTKCWICDNIYVDGGDVKVRDHCHITGKCRGSAYRDCNIKVKLNREIPIVFQNLKNYDSHLIMQELGKFNLKIKVILTRFKGYMTFSINNKLSFIDNSQFLSSSWDSLIKSLNKDDLKYLSQKFDNNIFDLVKQKGFYPYEYVSDFGKFQEELVSKENLFSSLTDKKASDKEYEHVLKVWNKSEMKTMKDYHGLYLKCDVLLLADVFEKFRNNNLKNYGLRLSHYLSATALS